MYLLCAVTSVITGCLVLFKMRSLLSQHKAKLVLLWQDRICSYLRDWLTRSTQPERMLKYVLERAVAGVPQSVVDTIDEFCKSTEWAMNVGDEKGLILDQIVSEVNPSIVLELGTYCGYSTIRIARLLQPGARLYTVEFNPDTAKVAKQIIAHAGVGDQVQLLVGSSWDLIPELREKFDVKKLDFVFLDHWKESYTRDAKLLEACDLLRKGTVLLADNVICPGAPDYLEYIRHHSRYQSEYYPSHLEYTQIEDGLEKSVYLG
ncbi:catechol O-methyltransferase A-like [Pristis pectinata]|uniref:catechol O-methyltransferase A-like n=1 Tax=Pristis pectinata TaxID=685728 RepID=UPI00223D89ED|nr:catechol O-methyltransferase A-like [Pristis pectinata]XP_051864964.1 catechol O-methyltransferase A-like [Pristis pectinata]XP_051864965.1 catechol O-methyltransferase A-like [Pristis pectinata]